MKQALVLCGIVLGLTAPLVARQQPTIEETIRQLDHNLTNIVGLLKDITDQKSAQEASGKLVILDRTVGENYDLLKKSSGKPSEADQRKLVDMHKRFDELEQEMARIAGNRRTADVLDKLTGSKNVVTKVREEVRVPRARIEIKTLTVAAHAYEIQYGQRPPTLIALVAPPNGKPFLEKEALTDPWGRPYQYDPAGPNNGGLKPDVWSAGPDPNVKTKVIGNWPGG